MTVEITVVDDRVDPGSWYFVPRYTGWVAAATRCGEVYMTSTETMVDNVLGAAGGQKIAYLNIIDHGNPRGIQLGSDWLTVSTFSNFQGTLRRLSGKFTNGATVHLQHCEAGQNEGLMRQFAALWNVEVRAGRGLHNPLLRVNYSLDPMVRCNGQTCWEERPTPQEVDWRRKMCCFPGDTPVHTPDGLRAIQHMSPGDAVLCADAATGALRTGVVEELETHAGNFDLVGLDDGAEKVAMTRDHFFATTDGRWMEGGDVTGAETLVRAKGPARAQPTVRAQRHDRVYNIRTTGAGNYLTGEAGYLVRDH